MRLPRRSGASPRNRGQALVEFALVLPIALLILLGILQFGFLFSGQIGVINAVRETARYGSTSPINTNSGNVTTTAATNICNYMKTTALTRVPGYSVANVVGSGASYVKYESYTDPHSGTATYSVRLTVHIEYKHPLLIPIISTILDAMDGTTDQRFQLGTTEAMRVENKVLDNDPGMSGGSAVTVSC